MNRYASFDKDKVFENIGKIVSELKKEEQKEERNLDRERELRYAQLIQGMKLSTRHPHNWWS